MAVDDGVVFDIRSITRDLDGAFFGNGVSETISASIRAGNVPVLDRAEEMRIGPPLARPGAIIGVGLNYRDHAAESGLPAPSEPVIFLKAPNSVVGPHDPVEMPSTTAKLDWEVELGVVIGRPALHLASPEDSLASLAALVTVNDISARDSQFDSPGGQWSIGKCAPGFCPVGPWLVPATSLDVSKLALRSWVNGELRQDSSTDAMLFDVAYLVWYLSQYMALDPGDLILTGTPAGVALSGRFPYLKRGDVVETEVEGLGRQRTSIR